MMRLATRSTKPLKSSDIATKSVSQLTSTMAAVFLSSEILISTRPSAVTRSAFLSAPAMPFLRISSTAASISPSVSPNAFLQSNMPAPVRSRSSLTIAAVNAIANSQKIQKYK